MKQVSVKHNEDLQRIHKLPLPDSTEIVECVCEIGPNDEVYIVNATKGRIVKNFGKNLPCPTCFATTGKITTDDMKRALGLPEPDKKMLEKKIEEKFLHMLSILSRDIS